jgi:hypothetical protein
MIVDRGAILCAGFSAPTVQSVCCVEMDMVNTKTVSIKMGEDHFAQTLAGVGLSESE